MTANTKPDPDQLLCPIPRQIKWPGNYLKITGQADLMISDTMSADAVESLKSTWNNFTQSKIKLNVISGRAPPQHSLLLAINGKMPVAIRLDTNSTSALTINEAGAAACGRSETDLKHAWFSMLQMFVCGNTPKAEFWQLPLMSMQDAPILKFRGIHLCVFPETPLTFVEKIIKLAAFLKFSHIVLEFWGTLKYETLAELAWPQAYSKKQVAQLLRTARQMGIQPVPMFNHWGHAAGSRRRCGRHVVLDQNPALEPLFEPDGWTWCLTNPATLALLKNIRAELMELFGKTEYFHLGCDEAHSHATCPECRKHDSPQLLADYLNSINDELKAHNIRPFIWGDALLEVGKWEGYTATSRPHQRTHEALDLLSRDFIINDWQYDINDKTKTATMDWFMKKGFEVVSAPWHAHANITSLADMAIAKNAKGMLLTTWNTLPTAIGSMVTAAQSAWGGSESLKGHPRLAYILAAYIRKLRGGPTDYKNAGWKNCEVDDSSQL